MQPGTPGDRTTILVVDDDPGIRSMLELALDAVGYAVLGVATSEQAADAVAGEPIDLVLLDRHLHGEAGSTLTRPDSALGAIPVVMMSADDRPELRAGAPSTWLQKPFTLEALYAAVEQALGPDPAPAARS
jgi:two-component system OmpR family response regulator